MSSVSSSQSFEDHEREYDACLGRIRTLLASGNRTRAVLTECDQLLTRAKQHAVSMQGLAEVAGDGARAQEAIQKLERDVAPLGREIQKQLQEKSREEIFYQAPPAPSDGRPPDLESNNHDGMMHSLIQSSDDMLRESRTMLVEAEYIGNTTLHQMGRQREQLHNANSSLEAVQQVATASRKILVNLSRKAFKNKLCLYIMIGLLLVANFMLLAHIWRKKHPHHHDNGGGP